MLVHQYLSRQIGGALLLTTPTLCLLVVLLQAMRLLPLVAAADAEVLELLELSSLLLVPLSAVALPASAVVALLAVLSRLESDNELLALRACGVGTARLAAAPIAVGLVIAVTAGALATWAEPASYRQLQRHLGDLLGRSALGQVRPGVIATPAPELTLFAARRSGGRLEQLFLEDRSREPATQIFAAAAEVEVLTDPAALRLVLEDGEVQSRDRRGRRIRATFHQLETEVELASVGGTLAAIAPDRLTLGPHQLALEAGQRGPEAVAAGLLLHRRLSLALGALGLYLLALALGLIRPVATRPWAVTLGATLVLSYHLLVRLGEALARAGTVSPAAGGWLPAAICWTLLLMLPLLHRSLRMCFRKRTPLIAKSGKD